MEETIASSPTILAFFKQGWPSNFSSTISLREFSGDLRESAIGSGEFAGGAEATDGGPGVRGADRVIFGVGVGLLIRHAALGRMLRVVMRGRWCEPMIGKPINKFVVFASGLLGKRSSSCMSCSKDNEARFVTLHHRHRLDCLLMELHWMSCRISASSGSGRGLQARALRHAVSQRPVGYRIGARAMGSRPCGREGLGRRDCKPLD